MPTSASRTAVLVCQGRAAADGRIAAPRFSDPVAMDLLHAGEREVVLQVRDEKPARGTGPRMTYDFVRGCAAVMVPRTVAIDDAIREHAAGQLVILGAGLDARAWRMSELAHAVVFEVDHPASQADKRERLRDRTPVAREVRFVATDFGQQNLADTLDQAGHRIDAPTTWVWEGVVPYLTPAQVDATVHAIERRSAKGCRMVINYNVSSAGASIGRGIARVMMRLARTPDPWRDEPHRSRWTPEELSALLGAHGFRTITDRNLWEIARALEPDQHVEKFGGSLQNGRVLVADRVSA